MTSLSLRTLNNILIQLAEWKGIKWFLCNSDSELALWLNPPAIESDGDGGTSPLF